MKKMWATPMHCSWHIAWVSGGAVAGVAFAPLLPWWFASIAWLVLGCVFFFVAAGTSWRGLAVLSLSAGLLLGLWRGVTTQSALQAYKPYFKRQVTITGTISEDTTQGQQGDQRMQLGHVHIRGSPLPGTVWVSTASHAMLQRSDIVTVHGELDEGFGSVPAALFRSQLVRVVRPQPGDIALHVRDRFAAAIRCAIPEPQASLGIGYLLGQHRSLPTDLEQQLRVVGLTHAVVASGYNLTILVAVARRLFVGISKFLTTATGSLLIASFMLITGLSPSMARAGLVSGLSLMAWYYGRTIHPLVLLPFAAAVTVLLHPAYAWGDVGWELSFAAFGGVILVAPLLQQYFWGSDHPPGVVRQIVVDTLSAQLATMPIILAAFGQLSPYALLANVLVLPLVPLAMLATFFAGLAGLLVPALAHWTGLPAAYMLRYSIGVVGWTASLPGADKQVTFGGYAVVASYAALVCVVMYVWWATKYRFRQEVVQQNIEPA
jgi:competence protein ComEC